MADKLVNQMKKDCVQAIANSVCEIVFKYSAHCNPNATASSIAYTIAELMKGSITDERKKLIESVREKVYLSCITVGEEENLNVNELMVAMWQALGQFNLIASKDDSFAEQCAVCPLAKDGGGAGGS